MKIGISSYRFLRLVKAGAMSQLDVTAAKNIGLDMIEFLTKHA